MPAPNKLIFKIGRASLSAFNVGEANWSARGPIVCKACAPVKTKMRFRLEAIIPARTGNVHWYVYSCDTCFRAWAQYSVEPVEQKEGE
jgi:hypothetical protein